MHHDADGIFDIVVLKNIKKLVRDCRVDSFRFPRANMPDYKDWPDYQVRLLRNNGDIEWRGKLHEIPYSKKLNKPIDQVSVITLDECLIAHLERSK